MNQLKSGGNLSANVSKIWQICVELLPKPLTSSSPDPTISLLKSGMGELARGEATPSIDAAKKIADALEVSLDHLVGEGLYQGFDYLQPNTQLLYDRRKLAQVNNIKSRLFRLNLSEGEMMEIFQKTSFPST